MFGWRRKSDGFDWHAYVRTTIKVRREARRERIDAARQAALDKAHAAGHAVVQGGKAAGKAAVQGAVGGASHGLTGLSWFWHNLARAFRVGLGPLGEWLMATTARIGGKLKLWDFAGPVALVGGIALASGLYRWSLSGLTAETAVPLGIGAFLVLLSTPALLGRTSFSVPAKLKTKSAKRAAVGATALAMVTAGIALVRSGSTAQLPIVGSLAKITVVPAGATAVEGRAAVTAADTLRVNGSLYRLSGIEAPDRAQACIKPGNRRWRCGEAAVSALEKLARSKVIACKPSGSADVAGRTAAVCTVDGKDIAGELVRGGHVFSSSTMFGGYASLEGEAKAARRGLWDGDSERPAAWRTKRWDDAKKASPDGCPIKAVSVGNNKIYVMPWSGDYRKTTVRAAKGERWFCSESDAAAAGYKAERT